MFLISRDKETKNLLLKAAKEEFLEYGYQKASLRNICKKAGVTTGALYFFFHDKEDLFASIVEPMANAVRTMILEHTSLEATQQMDITTGIREDIHVAKKLMHFYYTNKKEALLLLEKAQGSSYESFTDELVKLMELESIKLFDSINAVMGKNSMFNECTLHWFAHLQVESFLHVLSHDMSEEEAMKQIEVVVTFLRGGYEKLVEVGMRKQQEFSGHIE
jgi:AcrR family transcriptional regulator